MKLYRHGEILLLQVDSMPKGKIKKVKSLIVGHSETGHHHVLENKTSIYWTKFKDQMFVRVNSDTPLVHKKTTDKHNTITVEPGVYQVIPKTEYDPFMKVVRDIWD